MEEKDKTRARLEEMTKSLRQKAIEMEEAITISRNLKNKDIEAQKKLIEETEEKLRYYKYILAKILAEKWAEKRQRIGRTLRAEAPEDRVFAQASTGDEAEGAVPTIEERIFALNGKTRKETFEQGTLIEKMRAYLCVKDDTNYLGSEANLTENEVQQITHSITTIEEQNSVDMWLREYDNLCRFGEQLRFYFKRFQTCFASLAKLLNQWDSYEETAQNLTRQIREAIDATSGDEPRKRDNSPHFESEEEREAVINFLFSVAETRALNGATLKWDGKTNTFTAEIYGEGQLYERVLQEAMETEAAMSDFKALSLAAEEFIEKSELQYTPISIQMPTQNAKEERYTRYLVKNLSYFRSEYLRKRREKGSPLTLGEKKRALIPDYYETKPNKELYRDARAILKQ